MNVGGVTNWSSSLAKEDGKGSSERLMVLLGVMMGEQ